MKIRYSRTFGGFLLRKQLVLETGLPLDAYGKDAITRACSIGLTYDNQRERNSSTLIAKRNLYCTAQAVNRLLQLTIR
jgi:hypothetical protein